VYFPVIVRVFFHNENLFTTESVTQLFPAEKIFGIKSDNTIQTAAAHAIVLLLSTECSYRKKLREYESGHTVQTAALHAAQYYTPPQNVVEPVVSWQDGTTHSNA
jgi:hypothetical protein